MSNNYIALYTSAPAMTPVQPDTTLVSPEDQVAIKLKITRGKVRNFSDYGITFDSSNFISLKSRIGEQGFPNSGSYVILSNITNNLQFNNGADSQSYIFQLKDLGSSKNPYTTYFDFSNFNAVTYNSKTYSFKHYQPAVLNSDGTIIRVSDIKPGYVAMKNFEWLKPSEVTYNVIYANLFHKYILDNSLIATNNEENKKIFDSLVQTSYGEIGKPEINTTLPKVVDKTTGAYVNAITLPVGFNSSNACLFNYDTDNSRLYINGLSYIYRLSKWDRYAKYLTDSSEWFSFSLDNGAYNYINQNTYLNVYDELPIDYKIRNIGNTYISDNNVVSYKFEFTTIFPQYHKENAPNTNLYNKLIDKLRVNFTFQIDSQNGYRVFTSNPFSPWITVDNTNKIPTVYDFKDTENKSLADQYTINLAILSKDSNKKYLTTNKLSSSNYHYGSSTFDLVLNDKKWNDSEKYSINGNITYLYSIKCDDGNTCYAKLNVNSVWRNYDNGKYSNQIDLDHEPLWSNYKSDTSDIISAIKSQGNTEDSSFVDLLFAYKDSVGSKYTQLCPVLTAEIPYVINKIHLQCNGKPVSLDVLKDTYIKKFNGSIYYDVTSNYGNAYIDIFSNAYIAGDEANSSASALKYTNGIDEFKNYYSYFYHISYLIHNSENLGITDTLKIYIPEVKLSGDDSLNVNDKYVSITRGAVPDSRIVRDENGYLYIKNLGWYTRTINPLGNYSHTLEPTCDTILDFNVVTPVPQYYTYIYFGNNKSDEAGGDVTLLPKSLLVNCTNNSYEYTVIDNNKPVFTLDRKDNSKYTIYISSGFYSEIYSDNKLQDIIPIFNRNTTTSNINLYSDSTCKNILLNSACDIKISNDNTLELSVNGNIGTDSTSSNVIAYINVGNFINTNKILNISNSGYNTSAEYAYSLTSYYNESFKDISIFVDTSYRPYYILDNTNVFNSKTTIYTQYGTYNLNKLVLEYKYNYDSSVNPITISINPVQSINKLKSGFVSVVPRAVSEVKPINENIYFLNSINFRSSEFKFNIYAEEDNNYILLANNTGCSVHPELTFNLNSVCSYTSSINNRYKDQLVKNRFIDINESVPNKYIKNEILKSVAYLANDKQEIFLSSDFDNNIGIDIYFNNKFDYQNTNNLESNLISYDYTSSYNDKNTIHFAKNYAFDLTGNTKQTKITNLYYTLHNDINTVSSISINGTDVPFNENIKIPVANDNKNNTLSLCNLIEFNANNADFYNQLNNSDITLNGILNNINIISNNYTLTYNSGWVDSKNQLRPIKLADISDTYNNQLKYSFSNDNNLGEIKLSKIISITIKDVFYTTNVLFGFENNKIDIWTINNDNREFNQKWSNLLNYINSITTDDLKNYNTLQITGFSMPKWNKDNCHIYYQYGNVSNTINDQLVNNESTISNGGSVLYKLYDSDDKKAINLNLTNWDSVPNIFKYIIKLGSQTLVLNYQLVNGEVTSEVKTIRFKISNNLNYNQLISNGVVDSGNNITFEPLYITDKNLTNIYNTEPGYLTFKSISSAKEDNYKVTISFCTDTEILRTPYKFTVKDKDYNFRLKDYISTQTADSTSEFYQKNISYIVINQIEVGLEGSGKVTDKYYLNID